MVLLTLFTSSFNRAYLLSHVYDSLCRQTCRDFEWIVVDDGSTDGTKERFNSRLSQQTESLKKQDFPVRYFWKKNGGKHTAVNFGVQEAKGELILILDSDDELPETAVEDILKAWDKAKTIDSEGKPIGGVCGYMAHRNGDVIGKPVIEKVCDEISLRYDKGVKGDMCEVFLTKVLREHPFPEIPGEKFCPEALLWNRIAQKYSLYVFPKVIYLRDYLEGGLTDNIVRIRMNSPIASMMTYAEITQYDEVPFRGKVKAAINYWRFRFCYKRTEGNKDIAIPHLSYRWLWTLPMAWMAHRKDLKLVKQ